MQVALHDEDAFVRGFAIEASKKLRDGHAVESSLEALDDEDADVHLGTIQASEKLGDSRAVERLLEALHDKDRAVRLGAVKVLGELEDSHAVEPLAQVALRDEVWWVRRDATKALEKIDRRMREEEDRKGRGDAGRRR